jgi:hypothetical protein
MVHAFLHRLERVAKSSRKLIQLQLANCPMTSDALVPKVLQPLSRLPYGIHRLLNIYLFTTSQSYYLHLRCQGFACRRWTLLRGSPSSGLDGTYHMHSAMGSQPKLPGVSSMAFQQGAQPDHIQLQRVTLWRESKRHRQAWPTY